MQEKTSTGRRETNWYVITGGPSSGKTTTVDILAKRGYKTTIEEARHYIDTLRANGEDADEIRGHQEEFQRGVLEMQIKQESDLDPNDVVFLDRAIPDALAYYRFRYLPLDKTITDALLKVSYKKIFILDPLPLVHDYARTENDIQQHRIQDLLNEAYHQLPFPVVHVPVLPPEDRVDLILKNL